MHEMRKRNLISSLVLLLFCVGYAYLTSNLAPRAIENTTQPSFFPWGIVICLSLLSITLLIQAIISKSELQRPENVITPNIRIIFALILSIIYMIILPILGFLIANLILVSGLMYLYGERRIFNILINSFVISTVIFYLFREVFQILLPAGILEGIV